MAASVDHQSKWLSKLSSLRGNPEFSDFKIIVEDKEFNVHRNILSAYSLVFHNLFLILQLKRYHLSDFPVRTTADIFSLFLDFIYTGDVRETDAKETFNLFQLAKRFKVQELMSFCFDRLIKLAASKPDRYAYCVYQIICINNGPKEIVKMAFDIFNKHTFGGKLRTDDPKKINVLMESKKALDKAMEQYKKCLRQLS